MKKTLLLVFALLSLQCVFAQQDKNQSTDNDRVYWAQVCAEIATPVLKNMSKGELQKNMMIEVSPTWDNRRQSVIYMETFGRLMLGISPWLSLPDDNTQEGKTRKQLREWALLSYEQAVDPSSSDYLQWRDEAQALVDAAFIANSFIRAPKALWQPLSEETKARYIQEFRKLRAIKPAYNNWLLFRAMIEAFFISIDEEYDGFVVEVAVRKMNEWYLGDGWYSDGTEYALDYYNGYVIHPMFVELIEVLQSKKVPCSVSFDLALRRMQRYNQQLERMISPEGTFPLLGRSMTYRMAAFQPLALSAWKYRMPQSLKNGQVRSALTKVMQNMFSQEGNFNKEGYLQLGFAGHQPDLADYYTNNGSMYLTSVIFLPLGLPTNHPFWTDAPEAWTSQKAWSGKPFPKDYSESIKK